MSILPRHRTLGLTDADADGYRQGIAMLRRAGIPESAHDGYVKAYVDANASGTDLRYAIAVHSEQTGHTEQSFDALSSSYVEALTLGGTVEPQGNSPTAEADAARKLEIENLIRDDPRTYFRNQALQDELYRINAREAGDRTAVNPAANQNAAELAKLEAAMIAPKFSPEWRSYWKGGGEVRYRELLGGESAKPATNGEAVDWRDVRDGKAPAEPATTAAPAASTEVKSA